MLTIGILNNMPDAAVRSTERQFTELLTDAALGIPLQLKWFSLFARGGYMSSDDLWAVDHIDGLIATGTEPRAYCLRDEPYWPAFARTVEWATVHTTSTIWSCLGAHAAVLHLDDVRRRQFETKLHGIFRVSKQGNYPLLTDTDAFWDMPHSRWNGLSIEALQASGYEILAQGPEVGADMFTKRCGRSLFVFCQGHPEYDSRALMREYRRDVLRFHNRERVDYPDLPNRYFDLLTSQRLLRLRQRAVNNNDPDVNMVDFQNIVGKANLETHGKAFAIQLYRNWFAILGARQEAALARVALL